MCNIYTHIYVYWYLDSHRQSLAKQVPKTKTTLCTGNWRWQKFLKVSSPQLSLNKRTHSWLLRISTCTWRIQVKMRHPLQSSPAGPKSRKVSSLQYLLYRMNTHVIFRISARISDKNPPLWSNPAVQIYQKIHPATTLIVYVDSRAEFREFPKEFQRKHAILWRTVVWVIFF